MLCTGHCLMVVGTVSPTQHFHKVGYGICSSEDVAAHEYVLRAIRDAVEATVADRARKKQRV